MGSAVLYAAICCLALCPAVSSADAPRRLQRPKPTSMWFLPMNESKLYPPSGKPMATCDEWTTDGSTSDCANWNVRPAVLPGAPAWTIALETIRSTTSRIRQPVNSVNRFVRATNGAGAAYLATPSFRPMRIAPHALCLSFAYRISGARNSLTCEAVWLNGTRRHLWSTNGTVNTTIWSTQVVQFQQPTNDANPPIK